MDLSIIPELVEGVVTIAKLYHQFALKLDVDLEIIAFIITDEFFQHGARIALAKQ